VQKNKGSPGIGGRTVQELNGVLGGELAESASLSAGALSGFAVSRSHSGATLALRSREAGG